MTSVICLLCVAPEAFLRYAFPMPFSCFSIANANSPGPSDREGPRSVPRNAYDAENRLVLATPATLANGAVRVLNAYDHRHRRIRKIVQ